MYLAAAATRFEMEPFEAAIRVKEIRSLVTGVGPVETAVRLLSFLQAYEGCIQGVVHFGVGGAYVTGDGPAADLFDICLARREVFGDLGVCLADRVEPVRGRDLMLADSFILDRELLSRAQRALESREIPFRTGNFVTVCCTTGTARRGAMLAREHQGLCENMEGAAVTRVCREFNLPCLEVRCISNLVEDRDTSQWKLKQACRKAGEAAAVIARHLLESRNE